MTSTSSSSSTITPAKPSNSSPIQPPSSPSRRIPVTPTVLRSIFASSRTLHEERAISRVAFFRYVS
ncbi:hypothetical protein EV363DRAFT_1314018 [Boletus edulis]|nr:hypothetical protein EV363DRAFT_1314018 [Boletus edulis]